VHAQPELARGLDDRVELVERPDAAAGAVVRVLERDDRRRGVQVAVGGRGRAQLLGRDPPATPGQAARLTSPECTAGPPSS
jgi:hypothetical protein